MANEEITKHGVLVVDPSTHMAGLVSIMLRSLGRKDIREAYDAEKAMAELQRRNFNVVIIDDGQGFDGVALTRKLRASTECQNRSVPIIMMSSAPDAKRIAEARDAGATEFLRKPFAANHLQTRLSSLVINPRGFIEGGEYKGPDRRRKTVDVSEDRRGPTAKAG
ncbi:MAG: response regulator [Candidatus Devosia phytovorans]|uniref:Response regulator n=1 Tax=Candidatus Devosia phytovorans TaxID=3121372 RepID=A0AAJ5VV01_9HYPH|nr:response regulator [Devosia sp.]WEK04827.1 MAG: response regulator [Devosia sp.]